MFTDSDTSVLIVSFVKRDGKDLETTTEFVYFERICNELVKRFGVFCLILIREMHRSGHSSFSITETLNSK